LIGGGFFAVTDLLEKEGDVAGTHGAGGCRAAGKFQGKS
jgi:hypothetical protein